MQTWDFAEESSLYGLGNIMADKIELQGERREGRIDNTVDPVGFVVSTGGWGILWNVPAQFLWSSSTKSMTFETKTASEEDYYVIGAPRIDDAIRGYRRRIPPAEMAARLRPEQGALQNPGRAGRNRKTFSRRKIPLRRHHSRLEILGRLRLERSGL